MARSTNVRAVGPQVPAQVKENPRRFARVVDGRVAEVITEVQDIEQEWHPDVRRTFVEVTGMEEPRQGDLHRGGRRFETPPAPELTPEMRRRAAFRAGVKVGRSRFDVSDESWAALSEVAQHVSIFNELPGGAFDWPANPGVRSKSATEFMETFRKLSSWRSSWHRFVASGGEPPSEEVS